MNMLMSPWLYIAMLLGGAMWLGIIRWLMP